MPARTRTVRRSVALPRPLVEEAAKLAPKHLRENLNRLVIVSLEEYVKRRRMEAFQEAVAQMAADPAIRSECAAIACDFAATESDGLKQ